MARTCESRYEMAIEGKHICQCETKPSFYYQDPREELPPNSILHDRNTDSRRFSMHTAVQIPEISSFRLTELDAQARLTSSMLIFHIHETSVLRT